MCAEQDEINALKYRLDQYPGTLEEGFEWVLENASDLLAALDLSTAQTGLWEMTRNISVRMEDRVSRIIGRIRPEIRRTMAYIQAHLREKLSREQLSSLVSFGDTYFSRIFKAEVGMSYTDYLLRARMLAAQDLLRSTDMPISEIADACGFYDASYFIVQYREFYGETPREWREKNGETKA
jgi:transcriptional regulator GlxA family with amidase domain